MTVAKTQAHCSNSDDHAVQPSSELLFTCLSCGSAAVGRPKWQADRRKGLAGRWSYCECEHCGSLTQVPVPEPGTLATYYNSYNQAHDANAASRSDVRRTIMGFRALNWLTGDLSPRALLGDVKGKRILDYGCGRAPYCAELRNDGATVSAVDISDDAIAHQRGRGIHAVLAEQPTSLQFQAEEFDAVYLMQVFEHLPEPRKVLAELRRILKPRGRLIVAMPNASSIWRTVFKDNWVSGWFAPFHLCLYTEAAFLRVANESGFTFIDARAITPELWFRLNLRATLFTRSKNVETDRLPLIDAAPSRLLLGACLRMVEQVFPQGDCLVVRLERL